MPQLRTTIMVSLLFLLVSCSDTTPVIPATPQANIPQQTIIALGDSLTAGYGLAPEDAYPAQLEKRLTELGYNYRVMNSWVSGDTSAELLARSDWILEGENPSLVILEIGANDSFQGIPVTDIDKNIRALMQKLQAKRIPVLFTGMKTIRNVGQAYLTQFEAIYPKIAQDYNVPFMDFFLEGVAFDPKLNQADRIHPNREWYRIVVENLIKELEKQKLISK